MIEWTNEQWVWASIGPDALRPLIGPLCYINQILCHGSCILSIKFQIALRLRFVKSSESEKKNTGSNMYVWPKLLCSHKTWAEVSSSALWLLPKDCQLTVLCWEVVMCFLKSQPLMLSKVFYFKTPRVTLVLCTVSSLAAAFQLTPMYQGPDETLRDMIGYTVWNILQDTAHFICYNCT